MAKTNSTLSLAEIVLGADAETIRQALEARTSIDTLLVAREEAYAKIAAIEEQVNDLMGDTDYPFPEPEVPVATFPSKGAKPTKRPVKKPDRSATDTASPSIAQPDRPASGTPGPSANA